MHGRKFDGENIAASPVHANRFPRRQDAAFPGCLATGPQRYLRPFFRGLIPLTTLGRGLLDLFAPGFCRECHGSVGGTEPLCLGCLQKIEWIEGACFFCGFPPVAVSGRRLSGATERCAVCANEHWAFDRAIAAGRYTGSLRRLVLCHKFHDDRAARRFLVSALYRACRRERLYFSGATDGWMITSVPQHFGKRLFRGRDPGREIAAGLASTLGRPYRQLLVKSRWTRAQMTLSRVERRRSPRGSIRLRRRARPPRRVILVDDVLTTCTTAAECSRVLKLGGVRQVWVLSVARS